MASAILRAPCPKAKQRDYAMAVNFVSSRLYILLYFSFFKSFLISRLRVRISHPLFDPVMGLSSHQSLSVVIIIYFSPATLIATWICHRQGLGKQFGWLYLAILSVGRVVGAGLQIASEENDSKGLAKAASLIASIGVTALLLSMLGILYEM